MIQKLFPLDKNYILRQAQSQTEEELLDLMIRELRISYTLQYNPLRLMDKTFAQVLEQKEFPRERIGVIYRQLCGVYRYRYGDNQLELLFDGRNHLDKFKDDWSHIFLRWIRTLGCHESYVKCMLRMTLLYDSETRAEWAENRCKGFINETFDVTIVKRKGELKLKQG